MIRKKSSIIIFHYENNGQQTFFGRDNLSFKTVNMSTKQHFDNICNVFKIKKLIKKNNLQLTTLIINLV